MPQKPVASEQSAGPTPVTVVLRPSGIRYASHADPPPTTASGTPAPTARPVAPPVTVRQPFQGSASRWTTASGGGTADASGRSGPTIAHTTESNTTPIVIQTPVPFGMESGRA